MTPPKVPLAALETVCDRLYTARVTARNWSRHVREDAGDGPEYAVAVAWCKQIDDLLKHANRVLANHPKEKP